MPEKIANISTAELPLEIKCVENNYFGQSLKELRIHRNMKQYEAAELLGCTPAQWSIYESGKSRPNLDTIIKICEFMKTSPIALLGKSLDKSKYAGTGLELSFDEYDSITSEAIEKHRRSKVNALSELISS